jgi:Zn-dependent alcohol dehydrogenase
MIAKTQAIVAREPTEPLKPNWAMEEVTLGGFGDDEMLVDMIATGICHTDIVLSSVPAGAIGIAYPKIVGHEGIRNPVGVELASPLYPVLLTIVETQVQA